MPYLIDTNVAILLRDGDFDIEERVAALEGAVLLSIVTRVELEGGVWRAPEFAALRRAKLDAILEVFPTIAFDDEAAATYGAIVAVCGYSRRKILDRMIAAQAIAHRATLVTRNSKDFSDIPELDLLAW